MDHLPRVLFVCTYKGGRSQIADFYAKKIASSEFSSTCACFDPGMIGQGFVDLLKSLGIEINRQSPKSVFEIAKSEEPFEFVVCLCQDSGDEMCTLFRQNIEKALPDFIESIHWNITDFGDLAKSKEPFPKLVEQTCLEIESNVSELAIHIRNSVCQ